MPSNWLPENNKFSPQKNKKTERNSIRRCSTFARRLIAKQQTVADFKRIRFYCLVSGLYCCSISAKNKNKNSKSLDFHLNYKFFRFQLSSYRIDIAFFILAHSFVSPHDARRWSHPTEFCNFCFCQSLFEKGLAATGAESIPLRILLDFLSRMIFRNFSFLSIKVTSGVGVFIRSGAFFLAFMLILSSPGSTGTANNWWK